MANSLVAQVASRLGLQLGESTQAVRKLGRTIKEAIQGGDAAEVPGVGTFSFDEEGRLQYEPDADLAESINHRYSELEEVDLAADAQEASPEAGSAAPEAPALDPGAPADTLTPVVAEEPAGPAGPPPPAPPAKPTPAATPASETPASETPHADAPAADHPPRPPQRAERASRKPLLLVSLLVLVLALALGIVGGAYLGNLRSDDGPQAVAEASQGGAGPVAEVSEPAADTPGQPVSGAQASGSQASPEEPAASQPTLDPSAGGWTIVVASRASRAPLERAAGPFHQRLRARDYPIGVLSGTASGQPRYRLAVGQFPSLETAAAARDRLRDNLPGDAWVLRMRPGM